MYDLTSSKEDEFKFSQYISVIDKSLLLQAYVVTNSRLIIWFIYSIWYLFINYSTTLSMWWRRFNIDAVDELQILRSLVVTTLRLIIWVDYSTSSIFSSLTDINMSLVFFVDRLWLLEEMLSRRWKLCTIVFLITQRSNIVQTASNWDLLTLLTSIQTQNRIKRFVAGITYRWISSPASNDVNSTQRSYKRKQEFFSLFWMKRFKFKISYTILQHQVINPLSSSSFPLFAFRFSLSPF